MRNASHQPPPGRPPLNDDRHVSAKVTTPSGNDVALPALHPVAARMADDMLNLYIERGAALLPDLKREGYTDAEMAEHYSAAYRACSARVVRQLGMPPAGRAERIEQAVSVLMELPAGDLVPDRRRIQVMALQNRNFTKPELDDIFAEVVETLEARVLALFKVVA